MPLTEYHWFGGEGEERAVAEGFERVRAEEFPVLAEPGSEFVGNGDVWLYKRRVEE